jgi:hypothetical protein
MDEARTIRFYVAPVLFLMSLVWGAWFDPTAKPILLDLSRLSNLPSLIGLAAGGGFLVFSFGYVIGTFTYALLRLGFFLNAKCCRDGSMYHEAGLRLSELQTIWWQVGHSGKADPRQELSAIVMFDFVNVHNSYKEVHLWLVRRWSAFSIAATSVVGLFLSFLIGNRVLGFTLCWGWLAPVVGLMAACSYVACCAWRDGRKMLVFISQRSEL